MSRRTSRRRQQSMNQRRRDSWMRLYDLGVPVWHKGALFIPPDPTVERAEWVRQLTARVTLEPGQPAPMSGEVGEWSGMRIIASASPP